MKIATYAGIAAFLALGAYAVMATLNGARLETELATTKQKHAETLGKQQKAAREESEALRKELAATIAQQKENERAQLDQMERVRADAAAAGDASVRLWKRYADATAASCARAAAGAATVTAGGAAAPPPDLSADVPRRIDEAAGQFADFAELALSRSVRCAADYRAVERRAAPREGASSALGKPEVDVGLGRP